MAVSLKSLANGVIRLARIESDSDGGPWEIDMTLDEAAGLLDGDRLAAAVHEARRLTAEARNREIQQLRGRLARLESEDRIARTPHRQGGSR
jgi:hypothetical protein